MGMGYILRATMILGKLGTILLLVYNYNYMGYILRATMILGKLGTIWVWSIFCI